MIHKKETMEIKKEELINKYDSIMKGYTPLNFVESNWPMENGVYKQYSAYEKPDNIVSGTSYKI